MENLDNGSVDVDVSDDLKFGNNVTMTDRDICKYNEILNVGPETPIPIYSGPNTILPNEKCAIYFHLVNTSMDLIIISSKDDVDVSDDGKCKSSRGDYFQYYGKCVTFLSNPLGKFMLRTYKVHNIGDVVPVEGIIGYSERHDGDYAIDIGRIFSMLPVTEESEM